MPRIFVVLASATVLVFGWMFYQYSVQQKEAVQLSTYETVLREKTEQILVSLGKDEIQKLIDEQKETEVCCHFCNKKYVFSAQDMLKMLKDAKN